MTTQPYPRTADPSTPSPQLFHSPDGDDLASNISSRHSRANALGAGAANSSKQLVFPEPTTTKLLTKYFPLFPILITFKRANLRVVSTIGLVLFAMQHWAFVLNPHMKDHLGYQLGNVITYIMYGSQLSFYDPVIVASASVTAFLVVVYLLLAVTLVLVGCILFHLRPMDDHSEGKGITSDAARLLLNVMSTALLIPILQFCFASCVCGSSGYMWMLPNVENAVCWGSSHIAAFIPSLICLIVLIPLLYLKNTCVYDYAILSDTFQSRRHSVVEKMTFVRDVMSCLLFNVMLGWEVPLGFTILHAIFSAILVLSYMFFLPYYSMWMNRFYVCVHSVELVLSCGVVGQQITWGQGHKDSVLVLMVGGGCIVVLMCVICTDVRVRANFTFAMTRSCRCEYAVASREESELDTCSLHRDDEGERLLSDAGKVDDDAVNALPYPEGLMDSPKFCQYALLNQQVMESIAQQELNMLVRRGRASQHYKTLPVLEPCISRVYVDTDVALAASSIDLYAMQFEPEQLSDMMLVYGANIYSRALTTFADNAEVMLAFAAFITSYLPGLSFMGVDLVKRSLRGRTSVDQQFRCLRQANQLRVALGIRTHLYGVFSMKARAAHGRALQSIHKFWVKLAEPSVNIKEVAEVADSIGQRCEIAVGLFESALRNMQTPDYVLLGQIGDFFSEVMMASDSAQWCYDVRRDIYEARQARSMRGTRLHTATLEKVDELAKRTMELLRHEGRGGSQTWLSSSRILFHFVMAVTALFVVLVACCVGTLWVAVDMQRDLGELLVHSHLTGGVSIEVNKVMVLTSGAFRLDHSEFNPAAALSQLEAASRAITDQLKSISLMQRLEDSVRCVDVLFQSCIPYYWQPNPFSGPLSLWTMVHTFSEAARRAVANAENCKGQCSDYTFVLNSVGTISHALLIYSQEYGDRRLKDLSSTWRVSLASMLLTSIFSLVLVYLALHIALRRAVLNRIFTFQLCTLIPFDSLEMLASEARERYDNLRKGGKKWRARSRQLSTVVEQYPSLVLSPYVAATHQVTSCLKGAAAPAAAKPPHIDRHVHFSHVVSVIGSGDAHGVPADRVEDVDEEEGSVIAPRLLEHQLRQQKLAEQSMLTQRQRRRSLILSTFFVVALAACIVALIAIMYVLVTSQQSMYSTSLETFMGIESRAARVGFLMEKSLHAVLAFLRSGELIYYHNSHNYMSEMFYVIPHILGSIVPLNAAPKLLRMHEICQMVREMSIGASALAAKAHGVPLHYSMSGQLLDAMEEDELVELMAAKYSEAYQIAVSISDNILRGDLTLQFAYVIIGSQVPALSIEFRKLYSEVQRMIIETKFGDPANISICAWVGLALCCCAAFLCYAVLFTPRLQLIRVSIPRVNQVITAVAFSITVAAFVALVFVDVNIDRTFHDFHSSVEALNSFVSHTFSEIDLYVEFVLTLRSLPWFEAQTHASLESINGFVETISEDYLSAKNLFIVNELVDNGFTMMELNGIACALAIHAMHLENMPVEAPMLRRQMDTRWNAQMLPDKFHRRKVQYPESILFWNHTHDFSLSSKQQYVNAVGIVSSPEYLHLVDRVLSELQTLTIHFLEKEFNLHLASVGSRSPLLYVAIACLMLPIAATTVCIYHVLAALQRHLHLAEKADQMSYSHQRKFQHAMMRTAVFLVLLALGNALVYGVSMGLLYAAPIYVDEMLRPMETSNKIEELTQFTIISAMSNAGFFDEHAIETNIEFFTNVFNRQFITYKDGGVRRGLLPSTEYDIALFGSTDLDGTMPRMTSLIPIPCASLQHNSLVPSVPDDDTQFAHIVTVFSMMVTAIRTRLQIGRPVNSEELQLLKELQTATIKLEERQVTNIILFHALSVNQAKDATALIVLSALCLVATVSLFASIVIRLAKLMLAEEVSIRLLLHLIPTHVAHEVPAIAQYLETGAISNAAELQKRFDANEKLLQNILPEKIAARLKSGEQPIADTHDCVTMLFTDFVGFTKRSSTMQAREIVDFLNEVFLEFDTVVELLSLEKIKTIGDAFFMAAGLDAQMRDHALRVVEAGLMFFEALEEHNRRHPSRVPLQMRLGVHSGPVVAGVIGIKKVAYDLWGDSVEIANAMESTGVPGYVHISESTAELVRGFFKLEPRGELPREKEHIPDDMPNTYLVVGRLLPTPYMHLRRPKLGGTVVRQL